MSVKHFSNHFTARKRWFPIIPLDIDVAHYYIVAQLDNSIYIGNIMREEDIRNKLKKNSHELLPIEGLKINIPSKTGLGCLGKFDLVIRVDFRRLHFDVIFEIVSSNSLPLLQNKIARLKAAAIGDDAVPAIVAPYLSPRRQSLCRKGGVCFVDLSGNVYLAYESFYIEKIGFPNKYPEKRKGRDPFSDKATLILRVLLTSGSYQWGIRELADKTGLNPGYVSRMAKALEDLNYIARVKNKLRARSPGDVLDDWARAYNLKKNESQSYFCMAVRPEEILQKLRELNIPNNVKYALSVQAGASLIAPYSVYKEVHIYVENEKDIEFFRKKLDLKDADRGANVVLMIPHYRHSVFYDSRIVQGLPIVSDIQLYIDLHGYSVRGREQADHLFDKRLKKMLSARTKNE